MKQNRKITINENVSPERAVEYTKTIVARIVWIIFTAVVSIATLVIINIQIITAKPAWDIFLAILVLLTAIYVMVRHVQHLYFYILAFFFEAAYGVSADDDMDIDSSSDK